MRTLLKRYKALSRIENYWWYCVVGITLFIVGISCNYIANTYTSRHVSEVVINDIVLDHIPSINVDDIFLEGAILLAIFVLILTFIKPTRIPFVGIAIACFFTVRSFFLVLTHLPIPPHDIAIQANNFLFKLAAGSGNDLFFSGHAGFPFLMTLLFWRNKWLRYLFLSSTVVLSTAVFLGHLHYSIDVFSAYFITFGTYRFAVWAFEKEHALFLKSMHKNEYSVAEKMSANKMFANSHATVDISVVIPALNEEKFIATCVSSLKKQDFSGTYEIIVVDNNSTDATGQVAKKHGAKVVVEKTRGVCVARQRGTTVAQGRIIVSTDADCVFPKTWLSTIYATYKNNPTAVAVTGPYQFTPKPAWGALWSKLWFSLVGSIYALTGKVLYVGASNFSFRKTAWKQVGEYNTRLAQGGDEYHLLLRLQSLGVVVFVKNNTVVTSSRRLKKGLFYTIFVTFLGYYLLDYIIASQITGKSVLGHYPAFRE